MHGATPAQWRANFCADFAQDEKSAIGALVLVGGWLK
jgi:hypothetical protein